MAQTLRPNFIMTRTSLNRDLKKIEIIKEDEDEPVIIPP